MPADEIALRQCRRAMRSACWNVGKADARRALRSV